MSRETKKINYSLRGREVVNSRIIIIVIIIIIITQIIRQHYPFEIHWISRHLSLIRSFTTAKSVGGYRAFW
jgi:hypothetical protein